MPSPIFTRGVINSNVSVSPADRTLLTPYSKRMIRLRDTGRTIAIGATRNVRVLVRVNLSAITLGNRNFAPGIGINSHIGAKSVLVRFSTSCITRGTHDLLARVIIAGDSQITRFRPGIKFTGTTESAILALVLTRRTATSTKTTNPIIGSGSVLVPGPSKLRTEPSTILTRLTGGCRSAVHVRQNRSDTGIHDIITLVNVRVTQKSAIALRTAKSSTTRTVTRLRRTIHAKLKRRKTAPVVSTPTDVTRSRISTPTPQPGDSSPGVVLNITTSSNLTINGALHTHHRRLTIPRAKSDPGTRHHGLRGTVTRTTLRVRGLQTGIRNRNSPNGTTVFSTRRRLLSSPRLTSVTDDTVSGNGDTTFT